MYLFSEAEVRKVLTLCSVSWILHAVPFISHLGWADLVPFYKQGNRDLEWSFGDQGDISAGKEGAGVWLPFPF